MWHLGKVEYVFVTVNTADVTTGLLDTVAVATDDDRQGE